MVDYVRTDEEMAQKMTAAGLKDYDGVIFADTTGDLPLPDKQAFLDWINRARPLSACTRRPIPFADTSHWMLMSK